MALGSGPLAAVSWMFPETDSFCEKEEMELNSNK